MSAVQDAPWDFSRQLLLMHELGATQSLAVVQEVRHAPFRQMYGPQLRAAGV